MLEFGVMLSHWQSITSFDMIVRSGFTMIDQKASEGTSFVDGSYKVNAPLSKQRGLFLEAFHFYRLGSKEKQLANFLNATKVCIPDLYTIDFEDDGNNPGIALAEIAWLLGAIKSATGKTPGLYWNLDYSTRYGRPLSNLIDRPFITIAQYGVGFPTLTCPWIKWEKWQYLKSAPVLGVTGTTSIEVSYCNLDELRGIVNND